MAADNQMDPGRSRACSRFPSCAASSTTRRRTGSSPARRGTLIPRTRYLGNAVLSMLTKIASGYWHVADSQSGYTAISKRMLDVLDLDRIYTGYGFPNDFLVHLNVWNARVRDFPSRPIYGVGERSGIRYRKVVPRISWLLVKGVLLAAAREVRDPRLPPARLLLRVRLPLDAGGPRARRRRDRLPHRRVRRERRHRRPDRPAPDLRLAVHALRHVVRHGVEQRPDDEAASAAGFCPSSTASPPSTPCSSRCGWSSTTPSGSCISARTFLSAAHTSDVIRPSLGAQNTLRLRRPVLLRSRGRSGARARLHGRERRHRLFASLLPGRRARRERRARYGTAVRACSSSISSRCSGARPRLRFWLVKRGFSPWPALLYGLFPGPRRHRVPRPDRAVRVRSRGACRACLRPRGDSVGWRCRRLSSRSPC